MLKPNYSNLDLSYFMADKLKKELENGRLKGGKRFEG